MGHHTSRGAEKMMGPTLNFTSFSSAGEWLNQVVIDDNNYKWIVAAKGGGLICFDHGHRLKTPVMTDGKDIFRYGNGNLPVDDVRSVAKDKNGFIWVERQTELALFNARRMYLLPRDAKLSCQLSSTEIFQDTCFRGRS
jgi:hypothetical protein